MTKLGFILFTFFCMSIANAGSNQGLPCRAKIIGFNSEVWTAGLARAFLIKNSGEIKTIEQDRNGSKINYHSILQVEILEAGQSQQFQDDLQKICTVNSRALDTTLVMRFYLENRDGVYFVVDREFFNPFSDDEPLRAYFNYKTPDSIIKSSAIMLTSGTVQLDQKQFPENENSLRHFFIKIKDLAGADSKQKKGIEFQCNLEPIGVILCKN